ncbi:MAG: T9SS type A sorting domain-containing protein [Bacteroidota bacterium]
MDKQNKIVAFATYPNPTSNVINFSVQINVQLTKVTGQIVANKTNVNTLDIIGQPLGIYFVTLAMKQNS